MPATSLRGCVELAPGSACWADSGERSNCPRVGAAECSLCHQVERGGRWPRAPGESPGRVGTTLTERSLRGGMPGRTHRPLRVGLRLTLPIPRETGAAGPSLQTRKLRPGALSLGLGDAQRRWWPRGLGSGSPTPRVHFLRSVLHWSAGLAACPRGGGNQGQGRVGQAGFQVRLSTLLPHSQGG